MTGTSSGDCGSQLLEFAVAAEASEASEASSAGKSTSRGVAKGALGTVLRATTSRGGTSRRPGRKYRYTGLSTLNCPGSGRVRGKRHGSAKRGRTAFGADGAR